jgi:hypothetical protein
LVLAAFLAACERDAAERRELARLAWFESALRDTVLFGSCFRTLETARKTLGPAGHLVSMLPSLIGIFGTFARAFFGLALSWRR